MSVSIGAMTAAELASYLASAVEYTTLEQAIAQGGFYIIETGEAVATAMTVTGGPATAAVGTGTAIALAHDSVLSASGTKAVTSAVSLGKTATGYKTLGLLSLSLPAAAAAVAPLAGFAVGAGMYQQNPQLWTKLSQKLLPFCYPGTTKIPAWLDIVEETGAYKLLASLGLVDAVKEFTVEEKIGTGGTYSSQYGSFSTSGGLSATLNNTFYNIACTFLGLGAVVGTSAVYNDVVITSYATNLTTGEKTITEYRATSSVTKNGKTAYYTYEAAPTEQSDYKDMTFQDAVWTSVYGNYVPQEYPEGISKWEGETITQPEVWPIPPIIIVPDPVGPDYQPVTPVAPPLPEPVPEPAPVPVEPTEPEPYEPPEHWPDEDPWPTVIPFPWPDPNPDPEKPRPEVIPWPLPPERPEEWPTHPEPWTWPETEPWPRTPEEWPEEVPWPDSPPDPESWPEEIPWPERPDDWPKEVPWPVPWPEEWPETEPWPPVWPEKLPYPYEFPKPSPSSDPYTVPDPREIDDPQKQIDPYINPFPNPKNEPDPYSPGYPDPQDDPTSPNPYPEPNPKQYPDPTKPNPPTGNVPDPPIPYVPLPYSSSTGLISVYHPTQSELLSFANWLWVTWRDATIDKIWNNPFDGVIALFELYCTPTDVGTKTIRSGFLDSNITSAIISRYTEINCGTIGVPEWYGNYLDYAPYTKAYIYLPFIGVVELNSDDIVGHAVNVTYKIDEYNGSCIAQITVAKVTEVNGVDVEYNNIFYQYSGNCAVELPLAGGSQAAIKAGMIEAAAWGLGSVIGGIMGGSSLGEIGQGLAYGAASAVHSVVSAKSSVQHSGSFGSSYGALGAKIPFITVVRPKQIQVPNYNELYGYQAHKSVIIGQCSGYLRCREVHVISPTASEDEKIRIEQLLKGGVYVTE